MADYFISKLPSGHAIKDLTKTIATNTVRSEPMIIAPPETTVPLLRRQCAAVVWVRSDSYSRDSLEQLPATERAYLLKLFSLPGGGTSKAQAKRIDDHVLTYPLAAGAPPPAAGGAGGGAGGGGAGGPPPGASPRTCWSRLGPPRRRLRVSARSIATVGDDSPSHGSGRADQ